MTALEGYVPTDIIKTFNAFLDFCYTARKNVLTEDSLNNLNTALERFHHYREIFWVSGVRPDGFSLPRQHSLKHYRRHIENFGAPNGLCSSITESKHIEAVKKPWRRSNRYEALKQMLTINTRNDKLSAARADFTSRGMLRGTCLGEALQELGRNLSPNISDSDDEDEFSGPDGNGEDGSDLDTEHEEGEDDGAPGPVDGPPVFSEVVLAHKKGMRLRLPAISQMPAYLLVQPRSTPALHFRHLGCTSVKPTLMTLSGFSFFTNRIQLLMGPPHFTFAQPPTTSGEFPSFTRRPRPSAHQAIHPALVDYIARLSGVPHGGKPAPSWLRDVTLSS